jgi:hypothetical protein
MESPRRSPSGCRAHRNSVGDRLQAGLPQGRSSHPAGVPPEENVRLSSGDIDGVCSVLAQAMQHQGILDRHHQSDLRLGSKAAMAVELAEVAVLLGVPEAPVDHLAAPLLQPPGPLRRHPPAVLFQQLLRSPRWIAAGTGRPRPWGRPGPGHRNRDAPGPGPGSSNTDTNGNGSRRPGTWVRSAGRREPKAGFRSPRREERGRRTSGIGPVTAARRSWPGAVLSGRTQLGSIGVQVTAGPWWARPSRGRRAGRFRRPSGCPGAGGWANWARRGPACAGSDR